MRSLSRFSEWIRQIRTVQEVVIHLALLRRIRVVSVCKVRVTTTAITRKTYLQCLRTLTMEMNNVWGKK